MNQGVWGTWEGFGVYLFLQKASDIEEEVLVKAIAKPMSLGHM